MIEATTIDYIVHAATLLLATGLFVVSIRAYRMKRSRKFLYVCSAFGVFAVKAVLTFASVFYVTMPLLTALVHGLNLVIILLFFWGTVR
ncbi:MAG: hypothetical protein SV186_01960 [Candidatus Nanohaloarchaea archaeon]|nr:hypothetical protein [Candidatus Nanohaloarchaea archaeon]